MIKIENSKSQNEIVESYLDLVNNNLESSLLELAKDIVFKVGYSGKSHELKKIEIFFDCKFDKIIPIYGYVKGGGSISSSIVSQFSGKVIYIKRIVLPNDLFKNSDVVQLNNLDLNEFIDDVFDILLKELTKEYMNEIIENVSANFIAEKNKYDSFSMMDYPIEFSEEPTELSELLKINKRNVSISHYMFIQYDQFEKIKYLSNFYLDMDKIWTCIHFNNFDDGFSSLLKDIHNQKYITPFYSISDKEFNSAIKILDDKIKSINELGFKHESVLLLENLLVLMNKANRSDEDRYVNYFELVY